MAKKLREYAWRDVLRLQPLVHAFKSARYARIDRLYLSQVLPEAVAAPLRQAISGQNVLVTIAFNDPQVIQWHLQLCNKLLPPHVHLIADNSSDDTAAGAICDVSRNYGALYIRLPANPWTARGNGSRSHGAAMNMVWRHLLSLGEPEAFGFVDHDLFPTAPDDPFALLETHDWHGDLRFGRDRWFLWAGYCFFRFAKVRHVPLDFGLDWFAGLDTGGANWETLYKHADRTRLPSRTIREIAALEGVSGGKACFEWRGSWLHETGFGDDRSMRAEKRLALQTILKPYLD